MSAQIAHLNSQIGELYGPLYAHTLAGRAAWESFRSEYPPSHGRPNYFSTGGDLTEEEIARWKIWMKEVFHPMNRAMVKLIMENAHLIESDDFPHPFKELIGHVKFYDGIVAQWSSTELSDSLVLPRDYVSVINFPRDALEGHVIPTYGTLLEKRRQLLRAA